MTLFLRRVSAGLRSTEAVKSHRELWAFEISVISSGWLTSLQVIVCVIRMRYYREVRHPHDFKRNLLCAIRLRYCIGDKSSGWDTTSRQVIRMTYGDIVSHPDDIPNWSCHSDEILSGTKISGWLRVTFYVILFAISYSDETTWPGA